MVSKAVCCALILLIIPFAAYAENVFVPEIMVIAYNSAIEPAFSTMLDNNSSASVIAKLMEVEYLGDVDGSLYYANYDHSFYLYFEADDRWNTAKSVMAYADISVDSTTKNLPMYPFVCAVASLNPSCHLSEILEWYNEATYGDVFEADTFYAVYTSEAYDHDAIALFPNH